MVIKVRVSSNFTVALWHSADPVQGTSVSRVAAAVWCPAGLSFRPSASIHHQCMPFQDARNPRLRENVLLGIISASRLAAMSPNEMASDEMKELRAKLTKEAIDDHQMAQQGGTKSDLFKCGRCGQRDTMYNQVTTTHATSTKQRGTKNRLI